MGGPSPATASASRTAPRLIIGPAGGGKTAACLGRLDEVLDAIPFACAWVLLSTPSQRAAFRRRMAHSATARLGVEILLFPELCARLTDAAAMPLRILPAEAHLRVLRQALAECCAETPLEHFSAIARSHGFAVEVLRLIAELQRAGITPAEFLRAAQHARESDLARLYRGYSNVLARIGAIGRDELSWRAIEALDAQPALGANVDLLIVDGFDRFERPDLEVLKRLSDRARETILTLTHVESHAADICRRAALACDALQREIGCVVQRLKPAPVGRAPALTHLGEQLLARGERLRASADGAVTVIEAPTPLAEVRAAARRIKRLLLDGTAPAEVVVLARSLDPYGPLCREVGAAFGIPVTVPGGLPLITNRAVSAVVSLLSLADEKFRRQRVIDALSSPYTSWPGLDAGQIDLLDRLSRERMVLQGRDDWLAAVTRYQRPTTPATMVDGRDGDDEDDPPSSVLDDLSDEQVSALHEGLAAFLRRVEPPPQATMREYVRWVEGLIGPDPREEEQRRDDEESPPAEGSHLGVVRAAREGPPWCAERDTAALGKLKDILSGLLAGQEVVNPGLLLPWGEFKSDLIAAIGRSGYELEMEPGPCVLVSEARAQRGVSRDHVFVLGMAEGSFPRPAQQPTLLAEEDREQLRQCGLPLPASDWRDEFSLFYEVVALARRSLTFTRPYLDEMGNPWPESPYLRHLVELLSDYQDRVEHITLRDLPSPAEAASRDELALAVSGGAATQNPLAAQAERWLRRSATGAAWTASRRAIQVERARESREAESTYNGLITAHRLVAHLQERFGERHRWSATQVDAYIQCPFRFFTRHLLALQPVEEPEEGMDALLLGRINHSILERVYRRATIERVPLSETRRAEWRAYLDEEAEDVFERAPREMGFRPTALWRYERAEILQRLWQVIETDAKTGETEPFLQEVRFGYGARGSPALILHGAAGSVLLCGKIDRIDRTANGHRVIDYKSGRTALSNKALEQGLSLQLQVYLMAVRELLRHRGEAEGEMYGIFWHLRGNQQKNRLKMDDAAVVQAPMRIHEHVLDVRRGRFIARPTKTLGGRCAILCDFDALCRFNR